MIHFSAKETKHPTSCFSLQMNETETDNTKEQHASFTFYNNLQKDKLLNPLKQTPLW